ncbi:hypothetical protein CONLIGDRAFT_714572 [Coniochaeta ligniaria NRRL 30616]|uniref:Uncharacterized protein n=1 Tax=Coniochaeta ligniaria NRRL 30616 TaxID=1408157 RepID=A0A1J7JK14_9PEZI|nr:hypothetical protein CONLIGDRAFT_714572 [Coniochaeta ligniaria NRRL 30616]
MARTKVSASAGRPPADRSRHFIQYQPSFPRRFPPTLRVNFVEDAVDVWGWPSRGGVVVLRRATAVDFDFLGLDPVDPPPLRDRDQDAEDALCRRLLLLGAKWFDSDERRGFVADLEDDDDYGEQPPPTLMERRWVAVAYPDGRRGPEGGGGVWVAEFDTVMRGLLEEDNPVPENAPQVQLARNMAEKVEILKRMGGKFYSSLEDYERGGGKACLNSWATKTTGEVGPLVKTVYP